MHIVEKNKDMLGEWEEKFIGNIAKQNNQFWSNKTKAILQRVYEKTLDSGRIWKFPKSVLKEEEDEE